MAEIINRISDEKFIKEAKSVVIFPRVRDRKRNIETIIVVRLEEEEREFSPHEYIKHDINNWYTAVDEAKSHKEKMSILSNAKLFTKRFIRRNNLKALGYDFSNELEDLEDVFKYLSEQAEYGYSANAKLGKNDINYSIDVKILVAYYKNDNVNSQNADRRAKELGCVRSTALNKFNHYLKLANRVIVAKTKNKFDAHRKRLESVLNLLDSDKEAYNKAIRDYQDFIKRNQIYL